MLVRVFTALANGGSTSLHYWLQYFLPEETVGRINLIKDHIILETHEGSEIKLTNGILYKKLKRGRPKFTIPLLVEICRMYDHSIGVDKLLTDFLNQSLNTNFKLLPFYISAGKLVTLVSTKSLSKTDSKGCKVVTKTQRKETVLELNSSKRLQTVLVDLIRRQAL